jgi:hypothetical protein
MIEIVRATAETKATGDSNGDANAFGFAAACRSRTATPAAGAKVLVLRG